MQLEGLTKAGVFDEFEKDRNKIFSRYLEYYKKSKILMRIKIIIRPTYSVIAMSKKLLLNFKRLLVDAKEALTHEFKSLGYISNHPLNEYEEIFNHLNIISFKNFYQNNLAESLIAGTIMSIQEKKSSKGMPYAIIKFSDKEGEFELFYFQKF